MKLKKWLNYQKEWYGRKFKWYRRRKGGKWFLCYHDTFAFRGWLHDTDSLRRMCVIETEEYGVYRYETDGISTRTT